MWQIAPPIGLLRKAEPRLPSRNPTRKITGVSTACGDLVGIRLKNLII